MHNPLPSRLTALCLIACLAAFPVSGQEQSGSEPAGLEAPPAPIPEPSPRRTDVEDAPEAEAAPDAEASPPDAAAAPPVPVAAPPRHSLPLAERQCRAALRSAGATFTQAPRVHEPEDGCLIDHPVLLSDLGNGVALEPPALLACPIARATVEFMRDEVGPAAERHFDTAPKTLVQVSAYVCRTRHGTDTISQHALGTALDWGAIVLEDGKTIEVREQNPEAAAEQDFLDEIREAACGPFTTVLGPGSDADHADHFHFDVAERNSAYCR